MKILNAEQIRQWDQYTIAHEPIASIELMERASSCFVEWFEQQYPNDERTVHIFCGIGNNGGDGLAIARLLSQRFRKVMVYICSIAPQRSDDFATNLERLPGRQEIAVQQIENGDPLPIWNQRDLIVDAIFGSGLNRPVEGYWASLIDHISQSGNEIVAVDIPSGLFADQHSAGGGIHANHTLSFQLPKLAFFFSENFQYVGQWHIVDIGLLDTYYQKLDSPYHFIDKALAISHLRIRSKFDHKGTFGHALLMAGSYGKVGAAVLAGHACLRSGTGLLSIASPRCAYEILQISCPEAMVMTDEHSQQLGQLPEHLANYRGIGIGPGIGQAQVTAALLKQLLESAGQPLVIDADALNLLSRHRAWLSKLPRHSILTPHPKEFERLFGTTANDFERFELLQQKAKELGVYIILKGAHSCIASPDGCCFFNSTGNPGMATAGSGDVLTGLLTGLLAQHHAPLAACVLGVYIHGLAGDLALKKAGSEEALLAGDLVDFFGMAYAELRTN